MTYRNDVEALAARKHALDVEVANRTRERDEASRMLDEANARLRLPVLDNIRVAAPCKEDWSKMQGDDRVRHCTKCDQDVFNLSALTREQAESLIRDKRGELCARYFKRSDGTVITQDCAIGQRSRRRVTVIAAGAIASLTAGAAYSEHARVEHTMGSIGSVEEPIMIQGGIGPMPEPPAPPAHVPLESVLPTECDFYRMELRALAECNAIPHDAVRALDQAWHEVRTAWTNVPPATFEAVRQACADGREVLAKTHDLECSPVDDWDTSRNRSRR